MSFDTFAMMTEGLISDLTGGGGGSVRVSSIRTEFGGGPISTAVPNKNLRIGVANKELAVMNDDGKPIFVFFKGP